MHIHVTHAVMSYFITVKHQHCTFGCVSAYAMEWLSWPSLQGIPPQAPPQKPEYQLLLKLILSLPHWYS